MSWHKIKDFKKDAKMDWDLIGELRRHGLAVLKRIIKVVFVLDKMVIAVRFKNLTTKEFLVILRKHFPITSASWEMQTNSKAWAKDFKHRTYYDLGDNLILLVLTNKARALENIDALMVLFDPSPTAIYRIQNFWKGLFKKFEIHLAGAEFAFDFLCNKKYCSRLQRLLKRLTYYSYGKVAFRKGKTTFTDYINSRKSVKQIRIYPKQETYSFVRVEFRFKREKLKRLGMETPIDILRHDPDFIDELNFYSVDPYRLYSSLVNFNSHGHFADQVAHLFLRKGFHHTQVWARKNRICPNRCKHRDKKICQEIIGRHDGRLTGVERFKHIQECDYSKPVDHFRRNFGSEVSRRKAIHSKMKKAFKHWKKT